MIVRSAAGFSGLVGSVGTEVVGAQPTRDFLQAANTETPALNLSEFCADLARRLTEAWQGNHGSTGLWVFVAGVEAGHPRFWFIVNCTLDPVTSTYVNIKPDFDVYDDLNQHSGLTAAKAAGVATVHELLQQAILFFRNGALEPAAFVCDRFTEMLGDVVLGRVAGFDPITTLDEYAALVRMRQEFVKRLFLPDKGLCSLDPPPIGGQIYVRSAALDGAIFDHRKHAQHPCRLG
jgi:hypothetical protein